MNTERIKKISGGLLILLGICSLTFLPGMGFSTGTSASTLSYLWHTSLPVYACF